MKQRDDAVIFINYRRTDAGWPADHLADKLKAAFGKDRVFLDVRNIDAGADFTDEIQSHLERATLLIVLVGEQWLRAQDEFGRRRLDNQDDWVRREIRTALARKSCEIIPVLLDNAQLPNEKHALPGDISQLLHRQRISISQATSEHDINRLLCAIEEMGFRQVRRLPESQPLTVIERVTDFERSRDLVLSALCLWLDRIPGDERYDVADMSDLIRRHLSEEFGFRWQFCLLLARRNENVVGLLMCYHDLETNFAFIAYLVAKKGAGPKSLVTSQLVCELMRICCENRVTAPLRIIFEVDDPRMCTKPRERRRRAARFKRFEALAPITARGFRLRALDIPYFQPPLEWPLPDAAPKRLLLCCVAEGLSKTLARKDVVAIEFRIRPV